MRSFCFFQVKLIFVLNIILLLNIFDQFDYKVTENTIEGYKFQEQLFFCEIMIEVETLSLIEENEEEEYQYFSTYNLFQKTTTNTYNSCNFPLMEKHIQNVIIFESDNSPPAIAKA